MVGGGCTGVGVAYDAALRGLGVVLCEQGDLAHGTTGRFHGLLHSGARYAVRDPHSARECAEENQILRRIAADCVEDTGGLFVTTPLDDPAYGDRFLAGCRASGVPVEEISPAEALRREPRLHPGISRAFVVPDATIDPWKLVSACARGAREHGAVVLPYHRLTELVLAGGRVAGAVLERRDGERVQVDAGLVVNATGAWAGQVAALAGCEVDVVPGKGVMVAMNHRLTHMVVNRCRPPGDGDILVPVRTVSVIGTTDEPVADPGDVTVPAGAVALLIEAGEQLIPGFRSARALRAWAGSRPLYRPRGGDTAAGTRSLSRAFALLDHAERDGVPGLLTITGGKLTTFRRMAEAAVDAACRILGRGGASRTHLEPLPGSTARRYYQLGDRLARREQPAARSAGAAGEQLACECELVTRGRAEAAIRRRPDATLDDLRRALRIGMGPCQGGFCMYRAAGLLHQAGVPAGEVNGHLRGFAEERARGVATLLHGDGLRQAYLGEWLLRGVHDLDHLPA